MTLYWTQTDVFTYSIQAVSQFIFFSRSIWNLFRTKFIANASLLNSLLNQQNEHVHTNDPSISNENRLIL